MYHRCLTAFGYARETTELRGSWTIYSMDAEGIKRSHKASALGLVEEALAPEGNDSLLWSVQQLICSHE